MSVGENEDVKKMPDNMVKVMPTHGQLIARDERKELEARKEYYKKLREETNQNKKRQNKLKICKFIAKQIVPVVIVSFSFGYWYYGLTNMQT